VGTSGFTSRSQVMGEFYMDRNKLTKRRLREEEPSIANRNLLIQKASQSVEIKMGPEVPPGIDRKKGGPEQEGRRRRLIVEGRSACLAENRRGAVLGKKKNRKVGKIKGERGDGSELVSWG